MKGREVTETVEAVGVHTPVQEGRPDALQQLPHHSSDPPHEQGPTQDHPKAVRTLNGKGIAGGASGISKGKRDTGPHIECPKDLRNIQRISKAHLYVLH